MRRRPPTQMMRIRKIDLERMKELAKQVGKKLPDFQRDLLKNYRRMK